MLAREYGVMPERFGGTHTLSHDEIEEFIKDWNKQSKQEGGSGKGRGRRL